MAKHKRSVSSTASGWQMPNAVRLRVTLDGIEPRIWRELLVPLSSTLADVHLILQAAMGWTNTHLYQFEVGGLRFGDADVLNYDRYDGDARAFPAEDVQLCDFLVRYDEKVTFIYLYDFGDDWRHTVTFEEFLILNPSPKVATCVAGQRCCPPEDVGGPHGYFEFVRVLLAPTVEEREERRALERWSGGAFDPEHFDLVRRDKAVRSALRRRRQ